MLDGHRPGDQQRHQRRAGGLPVRPVWSASCDSFAEVASVEHRWVKALTCAHFLARSARCAAERPPGNGSVLRRAPGVVGAGVVICAVRSMTVTSTPVGPTIADTRRTRWGQHEPGAGAAADPQAVQPCEGNTPQCGHRSDRVPTPRRARGCGPGAGVWWSTRSECTAAGSRGCAVTAGAACSARPRRETRWTHVRDPVGQMTKSNLGGTRSRCRGSSGGDIGPSRLLHPAPLRQRPRRGTCQSTTWLPVRAAPHDQRRPPAPPGGP